MVSHQLFITQSKVNVLNRPNKGVCLYPSKGNQALDHWSKYQWCDVRIPGLRTFRETQRQCGLSSQECRKNRIHFSVKTRTEFLLTGTQIKVIHVTLHYHAHKLQKLFMFLRHLFDNLFLDSLIPRTRDTNPRLFHLHSTEKERAMRSGQKQKPFSPQAIRNHLR